MKKFLLLVGVSSMLSLAFASQENDWSAPYRPFKGEYSLYSGSLGDQQAPTAKDRKVSFIIIGKPARELFDSMAPDDKVTCGAGRGMRSRTKGQLWCTFEQSDGYTCYFGFDLRSGKSIGGGIC